MGTHNRSENGRGARVALCAHPSHTHRLNLSEVVYYKDLERLHLDSGWCPAVGSCEPGKEISK
jgi:hypothetical protein